MILVIVSRIVVPYVVRERKSCKTLCGIIIIHNLRHGYYLSIIPTPKVMKRTPARKSHFQAGFNILASFSVFKVQSKYCYYTSFQRHIRHALNLYTISRGETCVPIWKVQEEEGLVHPNNATGRTRQALCREKRTPTPIIPRWQP